MSDRFDESASLRAARRELARARLRRRRRMGLAAGLIAIAVVAVAVVETSGLASGKPAAAPRRDPTRTPAAAGRRTPAAPLAHRPPGHEAVPILMYHVIADPLPSAPYPGLYVPPAEFEAQMHALARAGYHAVTLDQVRSAWLEGTPLPAKPIVLTFDNGYHTQFTVALPVLRSLHWVGDENLQLTGLPPSQGGLGSHQVRLLVAAGWELDTQGFSHADLTTLDAAQLRYQVAVARRTIRARYHVPADWFCYPSGRYNPTVVAAVKEAGYVGSTTVAPGWALRSDDPYRLPRLRVLGGTTPAELLQLVAGTRHDPPAPSSYLSSG